MIIASKKIFLGQPIWIVCDGLCHQAWGANWHGPKEETAPEDPGTYEGGHAKPTDKVHNKWCARECERSCLLSRGEHAADPDVVNMP
jgi:hypothetical protein